MNTFTKKLLVSGAIFCASIVSTHAAITSVLQKGSSGSQVVELQVFLKNKGYFTDTVSGYYGSVTSLAVKAFQEANGIEVAGRVGKITAAAINAATGSSDTQVPEIFVTTKNPTVTPGRQVAISWMSAYATSCKLPNGATAKIGVYYVRPTKTTTYSVTCTNPAGSTTKEITITVVPTGTVIRPATGTGVSVGSPSNGTVSGAGHSMHDHHYGSTTSYAPIKLAVVASDDINDTAGNEVRWETIAQEGEPYTLTGIQVVRMGTTTSDGVRRWYKRQDVGTTRCSFNWDIEKDFAFPDKDPAPGIKKVCQVRVPTKITSPAPMPMGGPDIDVAKIPPGSRGVDLENVKYTGEMPNNSGDGIGAFRTVCDYSHMAFDDPIVKPGQPGAAHLHVFFGNTKTNAFSTVDTIANQGNSTCRGGIANRSSYWAPAMIDTRTGTPMAPRASNFYYKTGYNGIKPEEVKPFPVGLRILAGNPNNNRPADKSKWEDLHFGYSCIDGTDKFYGWTSEIPNCPVGSTLVMNINFPQCWDGVNLDSPDHQSHMSYTVDRKCPATHPVPLVAITFNVDYQVKEVDAPKYWRLSSDVYDKTLPSGYSGHADWFFGWKKEVMESFIKNCDQAAKDCASHMLGDGRVIF